MRKLQKRKERHLNWKRISHLSITFLILAVLIFLLFKLRGCGASEVIIVQTDSVSTAEPGENFTLSYTITNNGSSATRYNISFALEYQWHSEIVSLLFNKEEFPFNLTEYGVETISELPPKETLNLTLKLEIPKLTTSPEVNTQLGLDVGTKGTVALYVTPLSGVSETFHFFREITINPTHDILLETEVKEATIGTVGSEAERTAVFYLSVTHLANTEGADTLHLKVLKGDRRGWNIYFSENNLYNMKKFEQRNVTLSVISPPGFVVDDEFPYWIVWIQGECLSSGRNMSLRFNLSLKKEGGVNLYIKEQSHLVVVPGIESVFNVTLQNLGNYEDSFSLIYSCENYPYWVRLSPTLTKPLQVLENTTIQVFVLVSSSHPPLAGSTDTITLRAFSQLSGGKVEDSLTLTYEIGEKVDITIKPEKEIYFEKGGVNITIPFYLKNIGNCEANFSLNIKENVSYHGEPLPLAVREGRKVKWNVRISNLWLFLKPHEEKTVFLTVGTPLKGFFTETNLITLTASYLNGLGSFSNDSEVEVSIKKNYDFDLDAEKPLTQGKPGELLSHSFSLTNKCNFPLRVIGSTSESEGRNSRAQKENGSATLTITSSLGWEISPEFPLVFNLSPFESARLHFQSKVKEDAAKGTVEKIEIQLSYKENNLTFLESAEVKVVVEQIFKISLSTTDTEHKIVPGGSTTYKLTIHNQGNGEDTIRLNVTEIPPEFNVILSTSEIVLDAFSSETKNLTITLAPLSENTPPWNSKHRFKLTASSLLNSEASYEFFTPWTYVSFLGIFETENPTKAGMETIYKMDENTGELNDVVARVESYIYTNHSVAFSLRLYNIGFGNDTRFVIRDMLLPPFLSYKLSDSSFNELHEPKLVLNNFQEMQIYLIFSAADFNLSTILGVQPILFRVNIEGGEMENPKSITNSLIINFHYLKLDIWLDRLRIEEDTLEGREVTVYTTLYLSEGEVGKGPINSGIERIDYVKNISVEIYENNKYLKSIVIPQLLIGEKEEIEFQWKIPKLEWYEKGRRMKLKAVVKSYQCYQGDVDFNKENNQRENKFNVMDATLIDITSTNRYISIIAHIILIALLTHLLLQYTLKIKAHRPEFHYAKIYVGTGLALSLLISLLFSFPWNTFFTVTSSAINFSLNLIFFMAFPFVAHHFGKIGKSKKRIVLVGVLSVLILPLFILTVVLGAVFWRGFEGSIREFYFTLSRGSFQIIGTSIKIPLVTLFPLYLAVALISCRKTYINTMNLKKMIRETEQVIKNTKREIALGSKEIRQGIKRYLGGEGWL